ncbi:MAG: hypothetical protein QM516_12620, partial [Limnohabitans sp.]|nr:hypothetical protein [Limnohabitans sp.]
MLVTQPGCTPDIAASNRSEIAAEATKAPPSVVDKEPLRASGKPASDERAWYFPATASEYAKMVEPELGVPPKIDLSEAVEIPIYVDGVQVYGNRRRACDNPGFLGKDT